MAVVHQTNNAVTPSSPYTKTTHRTLSKRGVLWLGQTCNLRCYFCYFLNRIADTEHPEHAFMTLEKAKEICHTLRYTYGNTAIDIQGGEPTICPDILDLIRYCHEIGLYPTLITNGLVLAKKEKLQEFKDAGVRDFLVSLHGIGDIHDEVVCRKGAYKKIMAAIENMGELGVPFRFNCTMSKPVVPILPEIAQKAIDYGANAVNFLAFNPFEDQETGIRTHENVALYSEIKPKLTEAMDILEEAGIECNVRYIPMCLAEERHRKNFFNFQQLPYDHHEWDYNSWNWTGLQPQRMNEGDLVPPFLIGPFARFIQYRYVGITRRYHERPILGGLGLFIQQTLSRIALALASKQGFWHKEGALRASHDAGYKHCSACQDCALQNICDGFHRDYTELFGEDEAQAITNMGVTNDPTYYIRKQEKIVEPEDEAWAL
ncbi:MAG: radical SAM protein [Candidatus Hydrogenedentota bacterium]|nr:MAG: radical SAM protein [Candidatus Hydrogenedentota bacterium]